MTEPREFHTERRADVAVIALGTNDSEVNVRESVEAGRVAFGCFEDALSDQIDKIRKMHGNDVRIVLMQGMMTSAWAEETERVAREKGAHFLKVTKNRDGGRKHPSAEGHKVIANELTEFIRAEVLGESKGR